MIRAVSGLLLRPFVAAAAVAVLVALPVAVLGELSDNEARLRAQEGMFEAGSGIAERAGLALEAGLIRYREPLIRRAAGDLRRMVEARDPQGLYDAAIDTLGQTYRGQAFLAIRAAVTDDQGNLLMELRSVDAPERGWQRGRTTPLLTAADQFRGRQDHVALDLITFMSSTPSGCRLGSGASECSRGAISPPYLTAVGDQAVAVIAVGAPVFAGDTSRTILGMLLLELPVEVLHETIAPLLPKVEDLYVLGREGVLWISAHPRDVAPLTDLSGSAIIAKSIRSQPVTTHTRAAVTLREHGPDPFTGAIRPFVTAIIEPWHIFVVPDRSTLVPLEATLTQLRWVRLGFALILVAGAFALATAIGALSRQRATLAEANEALEHAARTIEAASRHKSEFLANMSHELRTPLNAVIGFSEVLGQRLFGGLNAKQAEYVTDIATSGRHLLDLVNEILDLSKVEAGRMELEETEFAPSDTIRGALAFLRERAARHGIEMAAEVPADLGMVVADERKLRQVLLNLLSNAVKFTPDGGWIGVTAARKDGEVVVSVRDTGLGIAPEDQATVFEEFQQVGKDPDRSREGTGLGLTLAKRFVELHGGRIWVESEVGKGSTFTFSIPVRQTAAAPARG